MPNLPPGLPPTPSPPEGSDYWDPFERKTLLLRGLDWFATFTRRIWNAFCGGVNFHKIHRVFSYLGDEIEDVLSQWANARYIDGAIGVMLDRIGEFTGLSRIGSDSRYRTALKVDAQIKFGEVTSRAIVRRFNDLFPNSVIGGTQLFPAKYRLSLTGISEDDVNIIREVFDDVVGGGIGITITVVSASDAVGGWGSLYGTVDLPAGWGSLHDPTLAPRGFFGSLSDVLEI